MPWETGRQISKIKLYIVFTANDVGNDGNVKKKKIIHKENEGTVLQEGNEGNDKVSIYSIHLKRITESGTHQCLINEWTAPSTVGTRVCRDYGKEMGIHGHALFKKQQSYFQMKSDTKETIDF